MMGDELLDRFHGAGQAKSSKDVYHEHFWIGYGTFGRGSGIGCGCGVCKYGWQTAKEAFTKVAQRYGTGERQFRQLDLFQ